MEEIKIPNEYIGHIKNLKPKFVFITGSLHSVKKEQCKKLIKENKYGYINFHDILITKVDKSKEEPIPPVLLCKILLEKVNEMNDKVILIDGFLKTLDQAIYFDDNVEPITYIINFISKEENCKKNAEESSKIKGKEFNVEIFHKKYEERQKKIKELSDVYGAFGILKDINADKSEKDINEDFKRSFYPTIYSIIGKRYSGKSELAKELKKRQENLEIIDFNKFKQEPKIKKKLNDNSFLVSSFINTLKLSKHPRIIIENFPENKEQYNYFVNNCKPFDSIFYLNADNSSCLERKNELKFTDPNYINCGELTHSLYEFEKQKDFLHFLKRQTKPLVIKDSDGYFVELKEPPPKPKPKPVEGEEPPKIKKEEPIDLTNKKLILIEVDVNDHKILTIKKFINQIQPYILILHTNKNEEIKQKLQDTLIKDYQFQVIDANNIINIAKLKNLTQNKENIDKIELINLIKPYLFQERYNKFILNGFNFESKDVEYFENNLCDINKFVYLTDDKILESSDSSFALYFKNHHKLDLISTNSIIKNNDIKTSQIEEFLGMTNDVNIVYGLPLSGKTSFAKYLGAKHNFTLLDFHDLIKLVKIKKAKADPENPDADPETMDVNFEELLEGLKEYLDKEIKAHHRILIDNFFIPGGAEPFLIDTVDKAKKVISTIGKFRNFYLMDVEPKKLSERYKIKEGITEELTEDQENTFKETFTNPNELIKIITENSSNIIKINNTLPFIETKKAFDIENQRKFTIIKHEYNINMEINLEELALRCGFLYVNVPKLIYKHFLQHDEMSKKLEYYYGKQKLINEITELNDQKDFETYIYYKYNPIHFEPTLINQMILEYINENYKEIEKNGNNILLSGYLNFDLLEEKDLKFNLPLLELQNMFELGEFNSYIEFTKGDYKQEIENEEAKLLEKVVVKKVKEELDEDGNPIPQDENENPEEEQPPEEEDPEEAGKFKPEGLCWTDYDGRPRNYIQIIKRLRGIELDKEVLPRKEISDNEISNALNESIYQKYINLINKQEQEKNKDDKKDENNNEDNPEENHEEKPQEVESPIYLYKVKNQN